jgi:TRAP-type mannitol/chloroaromatic compound transport system permease small subunit
MTTIVNSPTPTNESGGSSFLIGVIILIGFVLLLLYYGIPAIKNIGVQTPQVNIPNKIDINVKQTK